MNSPATSRAIPELRYLPRSTALALESVFQEIDQLKIAHEARYGADKIEGLANSKGEE